MYDDHTVYTDKPGSLKWKFSKADLKDMDNINKFGEKNGELIQLSSAKIPLSNPAGFDDPPPIVVANSEPVGVEPYTGVNKDLTQLQITRYEK